MDGFLSVFLIETFLWILSHMKINKKFVLGSHAKLRLNFQPYVMKLVAYKRL